ncbi:MAG: hypothetical protein KAJ14_03775 [Candidatus Omnitrophica bacterium]|nr:hypothetical protein [Candidatus Omnitrophota bacterium]
MIVGKENEKKELIKCSLCGYSFEKGKGSEGSCGSCPLNYGSCHFEKCPNCGYDIPQESTLWTFAAKIIDKFKRWGRNDARSWI